MEKLNMKRILSVGDDTTHMENQESKRGAGCPFHSAQAAALPFTAHRPEEKFRPLLEAAPDAMVIVNERGRIVMVNEHAGRLFGYTRAQLEGEPLGMLMPERFRERHVGHLQSFFGQGQDRPMGAGPEVLGLHRSGREFAIEISLSQWKTESGMLVTSAIRDVTQRKGTELALRQKDKQLIRRNREVQNFYHTLAHELKTPLTSAREFISILKDGVAGPVNPTQIEYLGYAQESCDELTVCINDMLDATRLDTGKFTLHLKPVSLAEIVKRVVLGLHGEAAAKNIDLGHEIQPELPDVTVDETRITQVIDNLVNNAIKFTPDGGTVRITVSDCPAHSGVVQISVKDSGAGIDKAQIPLIFDRLYQIKEGDAATGKGLGLGLYICRELVLLHGGEIRVESQLGQGSTFTFTVPINPPPPARRSAWWKQSGGSANNLIPNNGSTAPAPHNPQPIEHNYEKNPRGRR